MIQKVFSVIVALIVALSISAAERGKFIHVDNSTNKKVKPQLAFCQEHKDDADITTLLVKTVNTTAYNEFNDASRVLIRFSDGQAFRLNRVAGSSVEKNKNSEKKGNATISFYWTTTTYEVSPEVIEALENGNNIIKVRIVFKENESKDYEIAEGYQERMSADLLKSYQEASLNNKKANADLSDDDF